MYMLTEQIKQILEKGYHDKDDVDVLATYFEKHHEGLDGKEWADYICKMDNIVTATGLDFDTISFMEKAYKEFASYNTRLFSHQGNILKHLCKLYIHRGERENAIRTMRKFMYCMLADEAKQDRDYNQHYYSFRSFSEYSLKDIKDETISLAHPRTFNDPLDTLMYWWLDSKIKNIPSGNEVDDEFYIMMKKVAEHIKLRCLISAKERDAKDLSVLMWSHYAKNHTGFCVEYELPMTYFDSLDSANDGLKMLKDIQYVDKIVVKDEPTIMQALFQKTKEWEYEKEIRLAVYNPSDDTDFPTFECPGCVKAIYLGVKCSDTDRHLMEKAIGDMCIPLYQMIIDNENAGKFKKVRIG